MDAAKKRKPVWGDALVVLIILTAAVLILFILPPRDGADLAVVVTVDGETVWSCPLKDRTEPVLYTVEGEYPLTLEVSKDGVRVVDAACPGEDCHRAGSISKAGRQIVCLPNRTVVALNGDDPSYDAVTG